MLSPREKIMFFCKYLLIFQKKHALHNTLDSATAAFIFYQHFTQSRQRCLALAPITVAQFNSKSNQRSKRLRLWSQQLLHITESTDCTDSMQQLWNCSLHLLFNLHILSLEMPSEVENGREMSWCVSLATSQLFNLFQYFLPPGILPFLNIYWFQVCCGYKLKTQVQSG